MINRIRGGTADLIKTNEMLAGKPQITVVLGGCAAENPYKRLILEEK